MDKYKDRRDKIFETYNNGEKTLEEVGKIFNISRERVRQILNKYDKLSTKEIYSNRCIKRIDINVIKEMRKHGSNWALIVKTLHTSLIALKKYIDFNDYPIYGGDKWFCKKCKLLDNINNFYFPQNGKYKVHIHKICHNEYQKQYKKSKIGN